MIVFISDRPVQRMLPRRKAGFAVTSIRAGSPSFFFTKNSSGQNGPAPLILPPDLHETSEQTGKASFRFRCNFWGGQI